MVKFDLRQNFLQYLFNLLISNSEDIAAQSHLYFQFQMHVEKFIFFAICLFFQDLQPNQQIKHQ